VVTGCVLWLGGFALLVKAMAGALICAGPFLIAFWRKWVGGGDVKLMALCGLVAGAAAGVTFALTVLFDVAVAGGLQAALWMLAARVRKADRPKTVPYGVAIAAGTAWAFCAGAPLF